VATLGLAAGTAAVATSAPRALEATTPLRYWDTRAFDDGSKTSPDGKLGIAIGGTATLDNFPAGADPIPADAEAVFVNVTAVDANEPGFVSVYPESRAGSQLDFIPTTSNLNIDTAGQTIANTAIVPLGAYDFPEEFDDFLGEFDGDFDDLADFSLLTGVIVHTSMNTHILVDVLGYVPAGSDYISIPLTRALDTRARGGASAEQRFDVDVIDDFGPADATLAIMNITLVDSEGPGFVTAWPGGEEQPGTSNLNVDGVGQTRAGLAIVPIGPGGEVSVVSSTGGELLLDVLGYFGVASGFTGLEPFDRVFDSRPGRVNGTTNVVVTDSPDVPDAAEFVLVNVTAVDAAAAGFISVWPGGGGQPDSSNLNYTAGGTIANTVLVPLGDDGSIDIYTDAEIALLVDVIGYL